MHIGIIIHSPKGASKYIAEKLAKNFEKKGDTVSIEQLKYIDEEAEKKEFETNFDLNNYDKVFLGSPLIKGELSKVMKDFISKLPNFDQKQVSAYTTQFAFSSAKKSNAAKEELINLLVEKNIKVLQVEQIKWLNPFLGRDI